MGKVINRPVDPSESKKKSRSQSECDRRAKIKSWLMECKRIVPSIQNCDKKDEKGLLRHTLNHLQLLKSPPYQIQLIRSHRYRNDYVLLRLMNCFLSNERLLICNGTTKVLICSWDAFTALGYSSIDVQGYRLIDHFIYEPYRDDFRNEIAKLKNKLIETGNESSLFTIPTRMYEAPKTRQSTKICRSVNFSGRIRLPNEVRLKLSPKFVVKKAKNGHLSVSENGEGKYDYDYDSAITICGRIEVFQESPLDSRILSAFAYKNEYKLVINLQAIIIHADQRIVNVLGFEPREVINRSAYDFIHDEDKALSYGAHQKMLTDNSGIGWIVHRLCAANDKIKHIKSVGRILKTENQTVVELNITELSEQDGNEMRLQFQAQLASIVGQKTLNDLESQLNAVARMAKESESSLFEYSCSSSKDSIASENIQKSHQLSDYNLNSNFQSSNPNETTLPVLDSCLSTSINLTEALSTLSDINEGQSFQYSPYHCDQPMSVSDQVTIMSLPAPLLVYNTTTSIRTQYQSNQHFPPDISHSPSLHPVNATLINHTIDSHYQPTTNYPSIENNNLTVDYENSFVDLNSYTIDLEDETCDLKN